MLAAVLVIGVGLLGFGLLDTRAQVTPVAPIGPDERPIAQSKSIAFPALDVPKLETKDKPKEVAPVALEGLNSVPPVPLTLPEAVPALDAAPSVKLEPRPQEPMSEPKLQLAPLANVPSVEPPLAQESPKSNTPAPVVLEEMKIPPPERAFPAPKLTEPPKMPRIPESAPVAKPETPKEEGQPVAPKQEVKTEAPKPESPKAEMKPEPADAPENRPIPAVAPTKAIAPSVSVEVRAPESIAINQQLDYEIVVKNVGPVSVHQVRVEDELPRSVKYIGGEPVAELRGEKLMWNLGTLEVNAERRIKVGVKPGSEGDWRTKPIVTFSAQVMPVQVTVTRPKLQVAVTSPLEVGYIGEELPLAIEIKNIGTGIADKTIIRAQLSEGLFHPQARDAHNRLIEAELSNLSPGETRSVTLKVKVLKAGSQGCLLSAVAEGSPEATSRTAIQCSAPPLALKITGAQRAMVRSEPTFNLEVVNTEKNPSAPVQIAAAFPEGLEFVSATEGGGYDSEKRILTWNLGAMQGGQKRSVTVKARANSSGTWAIRAVAQAGPRQEVRSEWVIQTEGVPGLNFEISSKENPVEVGKEATYEIRIVNQGTSECSQIHLLAAMSEGMTPTSATLGDTVLPFRMNGQTLVFDPILKLAGQSELQIRLKARSTRPGDQRCKVQLSCDQLKQPIVKEESTFFFMQ